MNKSALSGLILLLVSLPAYSMLSEPTPAPEMVGDLDMTCGFTKDFEDWLNKNGKYILRQGIKSGTSIGMTCAADILEEKGLQ